MHGYYKSGNRNWHTAGLVHVAGNLGILYTGGCKDKKNMLPAFQQERWNDCWDSC